MIPTEAVETQTVTAVETPAQVQVALVHPTPVTTRTAVEIPRLAAEELAGSVDLLQPTTTPAAIQDRRLQVATTTAHLVPVTPGLIAMDLATLEVIIMALATLEVIIMALATLGATLEATIMAPETRKEAIMTAQLGSCCRRRGTCSRMRDFRRKDSRRGRQQGMTNIVEVETRMETMEAETTTTTTTIIE